MTAPRPTRRRADRILRLLERAHGPRSWRRLGSAVDVLVATILSQNTSDANSSAGMRNLERLLPSWDAVADARVGVIERCIRVCGLSRIKAPRIRRILRAIRAGRGRINLEFLRDRPVAEAYRYLTQFGGVGPKTAACVLLFAFGADVLPVDTHVHRVARRLGLVGPKATPEQTQEALTPLVSPGRRYAMHMLLIAHGRTTCLARNPRCGQCVLRKLCPSAGLFLARA